MMLIVIQCHKNPELPRRMLCCPWEIKSKYYPWFFILLFSFLFMQALISLWIGLFVGYLHVWGLMNWTILPNSCAQKLESQCCLNSNLFISTQNANPSIEDQFNIGNNIQQLQQQGQPFPAPGMANSSQQNQAFQGKGHKLGGEATGKSKLVEIYSNKAEAV